MKKHNSFFDSLSLPLFFGSSFSCSASSAGASPDLPLIFLLPFFSFFLPPLLSCSSQPFSSFCVWCHRSDRRLHRGRRRRNSEEKKLIIFLEHCMLGGGGDERGGGGREKLEKPRSREKKVSQYTRDGRIRVHP